MLHGFVDSETAGYEITVQNVINVAKPFIAVTLSPTTTQHGRGCH
jgi:hypothetical protein